MYLFFVNFAVDCDPCSTFVITDNNFFDDARAAVLSQYDKEEKPFVHVISVELIAVDPNVISSDSDNDDEFDTIIADPNSSFGKKGKK